MQTSEEFCLQISSVTAHAGAGSMREHVRAARSVSSHPFLRCCIIRRAVAHILLEVYAMQINAEIELDLFCGAIAGLTGAQSVQR